MSIVAGITSQCLTFVVCASSQKMQTFYEIPLEIATKETLEGYGQLISPSNVKHDSGINFYGKGVIEGKNMSNIKFNGLPVYRIARVLHQHKESQLQSKYHSINWIERHLDMTQGFIGLGNAPYIIVLGKPNHYKNNSNNSNIPDVSNIRAFIMEAGTGIFLDIGTWHDFPVPIKPYDVSILLINSKQVVDAFSKLKKPREMNENDIYKINLNKRFGCKFGFNMQKAQAKARAQAQVQPQVQIQSQSQSQFTDTLVVSLPKCTNLNCSSMKSKL